MNENMSKAQLKIWRRPEWRTKKAKLARIAAALEANKTPEVRKRRAAATQRRVLARRADKAIRETERLIQATQERLAAWQVIDQVFNRMILAVAPRYRASVEASYNELKAVQLGQLAPFDDLRSAAANARYKRVERIKARLLETAERYDFPEIAPWLEYKGRP